MTITGGRIKNIMLLLAAVLTLASCVSRSDDHCLAKIDQTDMSLDSITKMCNVKVLSTTFNDKMVYVANEDSLASLPEKVNEQLMNTVASIDRFNVINENELEQHTKETQESIDYVLRSYISEFIVSTSKLNDPKNAKSILAEATVGITYDLISTKNSQIVFTNTINFSYLNNIYDEALFDEKLSNEQLADYVISDISLLLKYNLINKLTPIRVVDIKEDNSVVLNQFIEPGLSCHVYEANAEKNALLNVEFSEKNETDEGIIASIAITEATPVTSLGTVTAGQVNKYDICRIRLSDIK